MSDGRRKWCKVCGKHVSQVGNVSWTGLCTECAIARVAENLEGLHCKSGPALERWRRGVAAGVGGVLLDDLEPGE
jgi:hypothetical protein